MKKGQGDRLIVPAKFALAILVKIEIRETWYCPHITYSKKKHGNPYASSLY
jgi:hypothetical protein